MPPAPLSEKLKSFAINILPLSIIVFLVIGLILTRHRDADRVRRARRIRDARPRPGLSRADLGSFMRALIETMKVTVMIFWIIACAAGFSQLLAFTGAGPGLVNYVINLGLSPIAVVLAMVGSCCCSAASWNSWPS